MAGGAVTENEYHNYYPYTYTDSKLTRAHKTLGVLHGISYMFQCCTQKRAGGEAIITLRAGDEANVILAHLGPNTACIMHTSLASQGVKGYHKNAHGMATKHTYTCALKVEKKPLSAASVEIIIIMPTVSIALLQSS